MPISQGRWAQIHSIRENVVMAFTRLWSEDTVFEVSTVWLGLDHNWKPEGPPIIFETLIFGGPHDQEQWRYSTKEEAIRGHQEVIDLLMEEIPGARVDEEELLG